MGYGWKNMFSRNKIFLSLMISFLILISSISVVCAAMEIEGGAFYTDGGLDDLTYASIDVGSEYSGDDVVIQIFYSRNGSDLNDGNMVPKTVNSKGFINVKSADSYKYFPDHAEIKIYDANKKLLDSMEVKLSPSKGIQTFGSGDYDHSYIEGASSSNDDSGGLSSSTHVIMGEDGYYYRVDDNGNILENLGPSSKYYPNGVYYPDAEPGDRYIDKSVG